jgi:hypothetical protein
VIVHPLLDGVRAASRDRHRATEAGRSANVLRCTPAAIDEECLRGSLDRTIHGGSGAASSSAENRRDSDGSSAVESSAPPSYDAGRDASPAPDEPTLESTFSLATGGANPTVILLPALTADQRKGAVARLLRVLVAQGLVEAGITSTDRDTTPSRPPKPGRVR